MLDDLALVTGQRARFGVLCGHALGVSYLQRPDSGQSWDGDAYEAAGTPAGACHCGWQSSSCPCPTAGLRSPPATRAYGLHGPHPDERRAASPGNLDHLEEGGSDFTGRMARRQTRRCDASVRTERACDWRTRTHLAGRGRPAGRPIRSDCCSTRAFAAPRRIAPYLPAEFGVAPLLWRDPGGSRSAINDGRIVDGGTIEPTPCRLPPSHVVPGTGIRRPPLRRSAVVVP